MSKEKLTRRAAAELLQITPAVMHRLMMILYDMDGVDTVRPQVWLNGEYTEKDNFVFRLCTALEHHLPNMSDVLAVIYAMRCDLDRLVTLVRKPETAGVVVIGNSRYVKWPGYEDWYDLWDVLRAKSCRSVEPSLRITTAIHLYTVIQPVARPEK